MVAQQRAATPWPTAQMGSESKGSRGLRPWGLAWPPALAPHRQAKWAATPPHPCPETLREPPRDQAAPGSGLRPWWPENRHTGHECGRPVCQPRKAPPADPQDSLSCPGPARSRGGQRPHGATGTGRHLETCHCPTAVGKAPSPPPPSGPPETESAPCRVAPLAPSLSRSSLPGTSAFPRWRWPGTTAACPDSAGGGRPRAAQQRTHCGVRAPSAGPQGATGSVPLGAPWSSLSPTPAGLEPRPGHRAFPPERSQSPTRRPRRCPGRQWKGTQAGGRGTPPHMRDGCMKASTRCSEPQGASQLKWPGVSGSRT